MLIGHFEVCSGSHSVYIVVLRWVNLSQKCPHEHSSYPTTMHEKEISIHTVVIR